MLARYAVGKVREGRCVGASKNINGVTSEDAQRRRQCTPKRLDHYDEKRAEWREIIGCERFRSLDDLRRAYELD
jgi:hypothetical protein